MKVKQRKAQYNNIPYNFLIIQVTKYALCSLAQAIPMTGRFFITLLS